MTQRDHGGVGRYELARNESTPAHVLAELAQDHFPAVRAWVAYNRNTFAETLATLTEDKFVEVRRKVAGNLNTPASALAALARDPSTPLLESGPLRPVAASALEMTWLKQDVAKNSSGQD